MTSPTPGAYRIGPKIAGSWCNDGVCLRASDPKHPSIDVHERESGRGRARESERERARSSASSLCLSPLPLCLAFALSRTRSLSHARRRAVALSSLAVLLGASIYVLTYVCACLCVALMMLCIQRLCFDFCAGFSACDAAVLGFETYLVEDLCRAFAADSEAEMRTSLAQNNVQVVLRQNVV